MNNTEADWNLEEARFSFEDNMIIMKLGNQELRLNREAALLLRIRLDGLYERFTEPEPAEDSSTIPTV